jgi:hypothetical protein
VTALCLPESRHSAGVSTEISVTDEQALHAAVVARLATVTDPGSGTALATDAVTR